MNTSMDTLQTMDGLAAWAVKIAQADLNRVVCYGGDSIRCLVAAYFAESLELDTVHDGWVKVVADKATRFRADGSVEDFTRLDEDFESLVLHVDAQGDRSFTAAEVRTLVEQFRRNAD